MTVTELEIWYFKSRHKVEGTSKEHSCEVSVIANTNSTSLVSSAHSLWFSTDDEECFVKTNQSAWPNGTLQINYFVLHSV